MFARKAALAAMFATTTLTTLLAATTANAIVVTPTYHVDNNAENWTGTAAIKVAGACKVVPVKYDNARFGSVYDNLDTYIGSGIVSSNGELIALFMDWGSNNITYQTNKAGTKYSQQYVLRINSDHVQDSIATLTTGSCNVNPNLEVLDATNSSLKIAVDAVTGKHTAVINSGFTGYTYIPKSTALTQKAGKFTGAVTFTGSYIGPVIM